MRLVFAIGNPGADYENTRHNIGFSILDNLALKLGSSFRKVGASHMAVETEGSCLVKPLTYVNRSGEALSEILAKAEISPADFLVVVDDINLEVGKIRVRPKGSDGGHNGLKDIARAWGSSDYPRLRVGVGQQKGGDLKEYVLGAFDDSEAQVVAHAVNRAVRGLMSFLEGVPIEELMRDLNRHVAEEDPVDESRS